jgi:hypothetical protein
MHEFARVSQAIIHGAAKSRKTPLNYFKKQFCRFLIFVPVKAHPFPIIFRRCFKHINKCSLDGLGPRQADLRSVTGESYLDQKRYKSDPFGHFSPCGLFVAKDS